MWVIDMDSPEKKGQGRGLWGGEIEEGWAEREGRIRLLRVEDGKKGCRA